ncbi:MAG: NUDIX hydrolase [Pseudorhodobacter sp.]
MSNPLALLGSLFRRPPLLQVAALCLRHHEAEEGRIAEVLLVRSLDSDRWIVPKGWPMDDKSLYAAAAIEAWEEAGVTGKISEEELGTFRYTKRRKGGLAEPCEAHLFRLDVTREAETYPEATLRERRWFNPQKAARKVRNDELAALILCHAG